jgi:predicted MFS family arabinose efflux permease
MRELFAGRRGRIATGLLVAEFVAAMQGLVIAAIMPRVVADLHGLGEYSLAFGSFFAAYLIFLPFAGPAADRFGLRPVLAIGLGLLAVGIAIVALAPNMAVFVAGRFIEGIGDGLDYAVSFATIAKSFPNELRVRMLSLNAVMWVVPGLIAPGLGALVATMFGWRWAFAGLLPLIAIAAVLVVPAVEARATAEDSDPLGALRLLFSWATLFARPGAHAALVAFALLHAVLLGADAYVALMLTGVRGLSLEAASFCITLAVVGWCAAAQLAVWMQSRFGTVRVVFGGAVMCCLATIGMAAVCLGAPVVLAFVAWVAGGAGIGLGYTTLSAAMLGMAKEGSEGAISSATALSAVVGILVGVSACGLPVAISAHGTTSLAIALAYTFAIATAFGVLMAIVTPRIEPQAIVAEAPNR